jgi:UDP-N-acetylmuramate--alanine ligase
VLDVYPARERAADFPGISGRTIAQAVADAGSPVLWLPAFDDALRVLPERLRAGDLVLTMGAGNIDDLGRALLTTARR